MTRDEKMSFLSEKGWSTKSKGFWWSKEGGPNARMADAMIIEQGHAVIASHVVPQDPPAADPLPMPESVREVLERIPSEPESPYHHISAGYASEMIAALAKVNAEVTENYQPKPAEQKTWRELSEREERMHAW